MKKRAVKNQRHDTVLMTGNEAIAEAAVQAGCDFYAGYPITPQNELTAGMARRMTDSGRIFIQSESELAAINMIFGASCAGARAMTSSSSPGISLKQEGISYIAGCRLPAVIVNIMRGGPGLGNIAPSQADYFQATKGGGHGDYRCIVLAPSSAQEAVELTMLAFDLADEYRTPVILLGDGILGQSMEPVNFVQAKRMQNSVRHKRKIKKPWALTGAKNRPPNVIKSLMLKPGELEELNKLLQKIYEEIAKKQLRYEALECEDAELIIVAYGTTSRIARATVQNLRKKNKRVGLLRPISLWPFPISVLRHYSNNTGKFLVVEMSAGQMVEDVERAVGPRAQVSFYGRTVGGVPTQKEIAVEARKLL